ncbi:MAG TPA: HPF/RaiA family ribosome-associated protein [Polyangia bacterium]|jgi:ribosomal subunit interface protein|nr:HPF/RaiA family ribosome-associated protein [Polyangia bacterium]
MALPVQITFRNFDPSLALEEHIREKAAKLDHVAERITNCRVVLEARHRHHHKGRLFHVHIELAIPGGEIVVNRDAHDAHEHEDIYVAIRDAFDAARRQLQHRTHLRAAS